jgi:quinol monooxygenase YgiN
MKSWLFGSPGMLALAAVLTTTQPIRPASAQAVQHQYVVVYGELAPNHSALRQARPLLNHLVELANQASGLISFSANTEIERPNFFSLVEVWQDAASYAAFSGATDTQQVLQYLRPLLIAPLDERDGNLVQ